MRLAPQVSSWHNELHPARAGFTAFAELLYQKRKVLFPGRRSCSRGFFGLHIGGDEELLAPLAFGDDVLEGDSGMR